MKKHTQRILNGAAIMALLASTGCSASIALLAPIPILVTRRPVRVCPRPAPRVIVHQPAPVIHIPAPRPVIVHRPIIIQRPIVLKRPVIIHRPVIIPSRPIARPIYYQPQPAPGPISIHNHNYNKTIINNTIVIKKPPAPTKLVIHQPVCPRKPIITKPIRRKPVQRIQIRKVQPKQPRQIKKIKQTSRRSTWSAFKTTKTKPATSKATISRPASKTNFGSIMKKKASAWKTKTSPSKKDHDPRTGQRIAIRHAKRRG
jgi:hypothetical protein